MRVNTYIIIHQYHIYICIYQALIHWQFNLVPCCSWDSTWNSQVVVMFASSGIIFSLLCLIRSGIILGISVLNYELWDHFGTEICTTFGSMCLWNVHNVVFCIHLACCAPLTCMNHKRLVFIKCLKNGFKMCCIYQMPVNSMEYLNQNCILDHTTRVSIYGTKG